ncbi:hypothetical protein E8E11_002254 [Didymella keratinophila]|nr:hypothetical protein E8E11_002254 [Didymella keratinophila]
MSGLFGQLINKATGQKQSNGSTSSPSTGLAHKLTDSLTGQKHPQDYQNEPPFTVPSNGGHASQVPPSDAFGHPPPQHGMAQVPGYAAQAPPTGIERNGEFGGDRGQYGGGGQGEHGGGQGEYGGGHGQYGGGGHGQYGGGGQGEYGGGHGQYGGGGHGQYGGGGQGEYGGGHGQYGGGGQGEYGRGGHG